MAHAPCSCATAALSSDAISSSNTPIPFCVAATLHTIITITMMGGMGVLVGGWMDADEPHLACSESAAACSSTLAHAAAAGIASTSCSLNHHHQQQHGGMVWMNGSAASHSLTLHGQSRMCRRQGSCMSRSMPLPLSPATSNITLHGMVRNNISNNRPMPSIIAMRRRRKQ